MKNLLLLTLLVSTLASAQPTQPMRVRTNLYVIEPATAPAKILYDGVMGEFFTNNCQCVDFNDAFGPLQDGWRTTFKNIKDGWSVVVDKRDTVHTIDSFQFRMRYLREANNALMLKVENVYPTNLQVVLHDNYLNTDFNVSIAGDTVWYPFSIDANPLSYDTFRFKMYLTNPPGFVKQGWDVYPIPATVNSIIHVGNIEQLYIVSMNGIKKTLPIVNGTIQAPNTAGVYILYDPKARTNKKIVVY